MNAASDTSTAQRRANSEPGSATEPHATRWRTQSVAWSYAVSAYLAPVVVASCAAFFGAHLLPPIYAAQAELVLQLPAGPDIPEQYKATQHVIAISRRVLAPVAASLRVPIEEIARNFSVDYPKDGGVMRLRYSSPDSGAVVDTLNLILDQYLAMADGLEQVSGASHALIEPPFLLEQPISPQPLQAAAIGAVIGLAFSVSAFAFKHRARGFG